MSEATAYDPSRSSHEEEMRERLTDRVFHPVSPAMSTIHANLSGVGSSTRAGPHLDGSPSTAGAT